MNVFADLPMDVNNTQSTLAAFFWEMIKGGVFLPPSQFEAWFLSSAITENDLKRISKAIDNAMKVVANM